MKRQNYETKKVRGERIRFRDIYPKICFLVIFVMAVAMFALYFGHVGHIKNAQLRRNLEYYTWLLEDEPEGQSAVFCPELPKLIKNDIKIARKKQLDIVYEYYDTDIVISIGSDGNPMLKIYKHGITPYIDTIVDFSIYNSIEEDGIIIYGTKSNSPKGFGKSVVTKERVEDFTILTNDKNLPFNIFPITDAVKVGDYSYVIDFNQNEDDKNFGYFRILWYKDGLLKNIVPFNEPVEDVDNESGCILTRGKDLYATFIDLSNLEKPNIIFSKIGKVDSFVKKRIGNYEVFNENVNLYTDNNIRLPIVLKDSTYYTIMPDCWQTYSSYSPASYKILQKQVENPNYNVKLVELKSKFAFVNFDEYFPWEARINFDIEGVLAKITYNINGIDERILLSEKEISELTKRVYSIEEFWEHIQKIRETFAKYYEKPEDF